MKVVIETSFPVRDQNITSYHSFPVYSDEIEKTLINQLEFLNRMKGPRKLTMEVRYD